MLIAPLWPSSVDCHIMDSSVSEWTTQSHLCVCDSIKGSSKSRHEVFLWTRLQLQWLNVAFFPTYPCTIRAVQICAYWWEAFNRHWCFSFLISWGYVGCVIDWETPFFPEGLTAFPCCATVYFVNRLIICHLLSVWVWDVPHGEVLQNLVVKGAQHHPTELDLGWLETIN